MDGLNLMNGENARGDRNDYIEDAIGFDSPPSP